MTEESWKQNYFAADVPDLLLPYPDGAVVTIRVKRSTATLATLSEEYTPDEDGNVVIRDIGKLAMAYLDELVNISGVIRERTLSRLMVTMEVTLTKDGSTLATHSTNVHYSRIRTVDADPTAITSFYSHYRRRTIPSGTPICLSYPTKSSLRLTVTYIQDGSVLSQQVDMAAEDLQEDGWIKTLFLTSASIAEKTTAAAGTTVAATDILRVKATLMRGNTAQDTIIYDIDRGHYRQVTQMLFNNCFGVPEVEVFSGEHSHSVDMDAEFAYMGGAYTKAWSELTDEHKVNSGHLNRERYQSLCDLAESDTVRLLDGDTPADEITITAIDMADVKPKREPTTALVTYRISNRNQRIFGRTGTAAAKVFDRSFDMSFE